MTTYDYECSIWSEILMIYFSIYQWLSASLQRYDLCTVLNQEKWNYELMLNTDAVFSRAYNAEINALHGVWLPERSYSTGYQIISNW